MEEVIVIGGGAAGMMAALAAAEGGCHVTLLERNEKLGKKIYITGKGRCNVTNACDTEDFFRSVVTNGKFLYSAIYGFDAVSLMQFLEQRGCALKTERGNRVFPVSDHASDVTRAFAKALERAGVRVRLGCRVRKILTGEGAVCGVLCENGERLAAKAVVAATGGLSYPTTGSTGDGYRFAQECGHSLKACRPALTSLHLREDCCKSLQGLALKNVEASLLANGKEKYRGFGELLFTQNGVSGPLILSASSYYAAAVHGPEAGARPTTARLLLDLKPALTEEALDKRLLRELEAAKNKQFCHAVAGLFPARLLPVMLRASGIDPQKKANEVTKEERRAFGRLIKHWEFTVTGSGGFEEAVITQGGVNVKEVNPSTMESRLVKGLYFAGEVLDVDALTGGFNLQIAFSTGRLAGSSVKG